jgi:hypothetical protein
MPRIAWVEDEAANEELSALFADIRRARDGAVVPDILRTMSTRPDFLSAINNAARLHFTDGALTRAQHEVIASYVASVNRCHY